MILLSVIVLALLTYFNWRRYGDLLYPAALQSMLWTFLLGGFWLLAKDFDPVSSATVLFLVMGCFAFTVGNAFVCAGHTPWLQPSKLHIDFELPTVVWWLLRIIPFAVLPFFTRTAIGIAEGGPTGVFFVDLRYQLGVEGVGYGLFVLAMWIAYSASGLSLLWFLCGPEYHRRTHRLSTYVMVSVSTVYAVLFTGRNWVLFLGMIVIGIISVLRRVDARKAGVIIISFGLVLFTVYAVVAQWTGTDEEDSAVKFLMETAELYVFGSIPAFDTIVRVGSPYELGVNTFRDFLAALNAMGFQFRLKPIVQEFVFVPGGTNVYTVYQPYYLDWGLAGMLIFQFAAGTLHGYVYRRATLERPTPFAVLFFALLLYPLLMQYSVDAYMIGINRWIIFAGILGLSLFKKRKPVWQSAPEPA